jgi:hypothetical protein
MAAESPGDLAQEYPLLRFIARRQGPPRWRSDQRRDGDRFRVGRGKKFPGAELEPLTALRD